jgi:hypothetical protein
VTNTRSTFALLATLLSLLAGAARADVAATGTFSVGVSPALNGMIFFATGIRTVLGQSVDLAADVGDMDFTGSVQLNPTSSSATFELQAGPSTQFAFHATGAASCAAPGCLDAVATFAGVVDAITDPMGVLPDATYALDGSTLVSVAPGSAGTFSLNAFEPQPTGIGTAIVTGSGPTVFFDSVQGIERTFEARVQYPEVSTDGTTTFVGFSALPGDVPAGYQLVPEVSVFVDVVTSGVAFTGSPEVCLGTGDADLDGIVDGAGIPVAELRLLHSPAAGQAFADVTGASPTTGFVCGVVTGLSPFVLARSSGGPTTTTTLPGACADPVSCIDTALATPLCGAEPVNPKLQAVLEKKLGVARTAIGKAASAASKKREKLVTKARKQLAKVGRKADAFVDKKKAPITAACRDAIRAALDRIDAVLEAAPSGRGYPIFIP